MSERRACQVLGQARSSQRCRLRLADDEAALTADIICLASQFGRYGYRRITALLHIEGWHVNHKRVERVWRRKGLKVPATVRRYRQQSSQKTSDPACAIDGRQPGKLHIGRL